MSGRRKIGGKSHPLDAAIVWAAGIACLGVFTMLLGFTLAQMK